MRQLVWLVGAFVLTGCATVTRAPATATPTSRAAPPSSTPREPSDRPSQAGKASWYGVPHHGRKTASGEAYDMHALTAAHRTLPLGTRLRVINVDNGRTVVVRINDRGPFVDGRVIDLSRAAARELGTLEDGLFNVRFEVLDDAAAEPPRAPTR